MPSLSIINYKGVNLRSANTECIKKVAAENMFSLTEGFHLHIILYYEHVSMSLFQSVAFYSYNFPSMYPYIIGRCLYACGEIRSRIEQDFDP